MDNKYIFVIRKIKGLIGISIVMKMGMLTFHRANNIGAVLQASALQKYLESYGDVEIIDYYPNNTDQTNHNTLYRILRHIKHILNYRRFQSMQTKEEKFDEYRNKYLNISGVKYYGDDEIENCQIKYDILISGSDQILNTSLTGNSKAYYLAFDENTKKISYASSFGREKITLNEKELIRTELIKFDSVSVREQSALDNIKQEIPIKVELVLDPVFLLSKDEWLLRANKKLELPRRYILVYSMEASEGLEELAMKAKKHLNIPVIVVRGGGISGRIIGKEDLTCGPSEFLQYIAHADIVITNSFHGIAMSLIFEKNFYAVSHSSRNTRIENILQLVNQKEKMISSAYDSDLQKMIRGDLCKSNLDSYIDMSKRYIQNSIK